MTKKLKQKTSVTRKHVRLLKYKCILMPIVTINIKEID